MFDRCCSTGAPKIKYNIIHKPKPIILSESMDENIKNLLWYVPNISSFQSFKNELIEDKLYNDFSFSFILHEMGIDEDQDVKLLDSKTAIDDDDWNYYLNEICCDCQKVIISAIASQSKTNNLLRCIRNCIAHGRFAVIDDNYFIGFNTSSDAPNSAKKAIVKIKPELLLNALKKLMSPYGREILIKHALNRVGYVVSESAAFDMLAEKDGRKFAIELKQFKGKRYLHLSDVEDILNRMRKMPADVERVLFIDTSQVIKEVNVEVAKIDNFRIIDSSQIKKLLNNPPEDILLKK
ncbi:restriction endonuclease [Butyrivibrio sp. WCD3002]|uniref:restriction endonuclease n=1 Tax=Butyrivibrio sp. WCD3002 TaxID=1280676 RepID=UPI00040E9DEC|nr:hypothetical protein [Butyrivibrio sp. WCD3002]